MADLAALSDQDLLAALGQGAAAPDLGQLSDGQLMQALVADEAQRQGVPPDLATRVAQTESSLNPQTAPSPKGAIGIMQLMPGTAKDLGVDPHDPLQNIQGGVRYLKQQLDRFGDPQLAAAAYNAGPGNVQKYGGVPPFAETLGYVQKTAPQAGPRPLPLPRMSEAANPVQQTARTPMQLAGDLAASQQPLPSEQTGTVSQAIGAIPAVAGAASVLLPTPANPLLDVALSSAVGLGLGAMDRVNARVQASGRTDPAAYIDAAKSLDSADGWAIGKSALLWGGLTGAGRLVNRSIFGPIDPERVDALTRLQREAGATPPATLAKQGRELRDYAAALPGRTFDPPDPKATQAAYAKVRANAPGPLVAIDANKALQDAVEGAARKGFGMPAALVEPVGAGGVTNVNDLLERLSGIGEHMRVQEDGSRLLNYGIAARLYGKFKDAVRTALPASAQPAFEAATEAASRQAVLTDVETLFRGARNVKTGLNGLTLSNNILRNEKDLTTDLGAVTVKRLQNVGESLFRLQEKPEGRQFTQLMAQSLVGAGVGAVGGAGMATALGESPARGAEYGAGTGVLGIGVAGAVGRRVLDPWFSHSLESLSRLRPGTDQFFTVAGRLLAASQQPPPPQAAPPPLPRPYPIGPNGPRPLGQVAAQ